jgi:hypothetical protein
MGDRRTAVIIGLTVVVVVGLVLTWAFSGGRTVSADLKEITDPAVIKSHLEISRVGIATGENFFGHKIRAISGTLTNNSDKPVRFVESKVTFFDYNGKSVQETVEKVYGTAQKPLVPGNAYRFEINFENLPNTWNHRVPTFEIVKIAY